MQPHTPHTPGNLKRNMIAPVLEVLEDEIQIHVRQDLCPLFTWIANHDEKVSPRKKKSRRASGSNSEKKRRARGERKCATKNHESKRYCKPKMCATICSATPTREHSRFALK
jgi:hypothetical protein